MATSRFSLIVARLRRRLEYRSEAPRDCELEDDRIRQNTYDIRMIDAAKKRNKDPRARVLRRGFRGECCGQHPSSAERARTNLLSNENRGAEI